MKRLNRIFFYTVFLAGCKPAGNSTALFADDKGSMDRGSHFHCKDQDKGKFRPYYVKWDVTTQQAIDYSARPKGLLGQHAMTSLEECHAAVEAANQEDGVICSRTGLDGWKPTLYTGTSPGRVDFGYLGGSSIMKFSDCLTATKHSSKKGVCYWGGSDWYSSLIDRAQVSGGPFKRLEDCVDTTK